MKDDNLESKNFNEFDAKMFDEVYLQCLEANKNKETPIGCIFYNTKENKIVAKAHNLTNKLKCAIKHAEIICIQYLETELNYKKSDFNNCILYVSCEPCIMCAYALNLISIKEVKFGCFNERFGGNGSILSLDLKDEGYISKGGYMQELWINLLKEFYEKGNENLPLEMRHRKNIIKKD